MTAGPGCAAGGAVQTAHRHQAPGSTHKGCVAQVPRSGVQGD
eukprot:CAMPEP_0181172342 /NCGR_PEP_ID=MMETSP1096-20121128/2400_1 /TAXON_ID=156174 ORGANISM="Chrysochromulina ericina, Strain CCMP281" /NCGR_SAMPLE_ID=MMETSP1096 /ASSEMBLY_ACC=CAM_ASM_000453 /LENGTH=41 /DNA_ID= /DNA_START= /DNA_END= /DNA_ORIENTATION=